MDTSLLRRSEMKMASIRRIRYGAAISVWIIASTLCGAQYLGPTVAEGSHANIPAEMAANPPSAEVLIHPGDILSIYVYGAPELTLNQMSATGSMTGANMIEGIKVDDQGNIVLAYLGAVKVAGMAASKVAVLLRQLLLDGGFLTDPQVSVALTESPNQFVSVIGEVAKPIPVPYSSTMRLFDAISACGGFTLQASHSVVVHRRDSGLQIMVDLGVNPLSAGPTNLPLQAGDTVVVSRMGSIFVVGEVRSPSSYMAPSNEQLTVMKAIAMAGGLKYGAALSKARIYRATSDTEKVKIDLNLKKIMDGKQQDVVLASNDILYIPSNTFKAIVAGGGVGVAESIFYGATYAEATLK